MVFTKKWQRKGVKVLMLCSLCLYWSGSYCLVTQFGFVINILMLHYSCGMWRILIKISRLC